MGAHPMQHQLRHRPQAPRLIRRWPARRGPAAALHGTPMAAHATARLAPPVATATFVVPVAAVATVPTSSAGAPMRVATPTATATPVPAMETPTPTAAPATPTARLSLP